MFDPDDDDLCASLERLNRAWRLAHPAARVAFLLKKIGEPFATPDRAKLVEHRRDRKLKK